MDEFRENARIAVCTKLDRARQLEVGKATHKTAIKAVSLLFLAAIVLYNAANILFIHDNALFLALISLGPCVVLFISAFWGYYPFVLLRGQKAFNRDGRWPEYRIEFFDEGFATHSAISKKRYDHAYGEITEAKRTAHLLVLLCGTTIVALDTSQMLEGTEDDLYALLRSKCPSLRL